jgi:hypothetical protein
MNKLLDLIYLPLPATVFDALQFQFWNSENNGQLSSTVQSTVPDECRSAGVYFLSGKRIIWSRCAFLVAFRPHRSRKNRTVRAHHSGRSSENFEFLCARGSGKDFNKNIRFCDEIKKNTCLRLKYDSIPKFVSRQGLPVAGAYEHAPNKFGIVQTNGAFLAWPCRPAWPLWLQ